MSSLAIVILSSLALGLGVTVLANWRRGVVLLFIWLYVENLIRVALPDKPPQVLLVKEAIIGLTYLSYYGSLLISGRRFNLPAWIGVFFWALPTGIVGLISAFNNHTPLAFVGLGIRGYYWYIPVVLLGYEFFRNEEHLKKFLRTLVFLSIPMLAVAVFQYVFWHIDSPFIRPLSGGYHSASLGDVYLIPGIFGSHARFARVEFFAFMLGLPFVSLGGERRNCLVMGAITAAFACFMMTGYRTVMFLGTMAGLSFLYIFSSKKNTFKALRLMVILFVGLALIICWREDVRGFLLLDTRSEILMRPIWTTQAAMEGFDKYGTIGFGLGTMSQGIDYLVDPEQKPQVIQNLLDWYESGMARIGFETGFLGLLAWVVFLAIFLARCKRELGCQGSAFARDVVLVILLFLSAVTLEFTLIRHQTFQDATTMVLFWFFAGVLFRIKELVR